MSAKFTWHPSPDVIVGKLVGVVRKRKLAVAKKIFDGVVAKTPVYTGSARASWRASVNSPDYSVTRYTVAGASVMSPTFPLQEVPAYGQVYITNATPYITLLEYGWSKQAPAGMVRVTLASLGITSVQS